MVKKWKNAGTRWKPRYKSKEKYRVRLIFPWNYGSKSNVYFFFFTPAVSGTMQETCGLAWGTTWGKQSFNDYRICAQWHGSVMKMFPSHLHQFTESFICTRIQKSIYNSCKNSQFLWVLTSSFPILKTRQRLRWRSLSLFFHVSFQWKVRSWGSHF